MSFDTASSLAGSYLSRNGTKAACVLSYGGKRRRKEAKGTRISSARYPA
jgi:hypothetical protein